MKLLFVVHRYVPFEGGSEFYVRDMAEEMLHRGHDVTVLTHEHQGDQNGVKVSNDYVTILNQKWDMIFVHGGDVVSQDVVHYNAEIFPRIDVPVCYMLIKPSESVACMNGLKWHPYIAYSSQLDMDFIKKHGVQHKARRIRHGIQIPESLSLSAVDQPAYYISAGGFWPHKAMQPLADAWANSDLLYELHLYGYGAFENIPKVTDPRIKIFAGKSKQEVLDAISGSQGYIMNSYEEGYGLVLLEAMSMFVPWFARSGAGAADELSEYGVTYKDESELISFIHEDKKPNQGRMGAFDHFVTNHTIKQTCNDLEDIIYEYHGWNLYHKP